MALDKSGKQLPRGITWLPKKELYMGRFQYEGQSYTVYAKSLTQTSHVKNGIRTLKNQYFSPQNTLMRLFLSVPMRPACILGDAEQSWL